MFDLYRDEKRIFTSDDYAVLIDQCRALDAQSVLEFGPGISTLAFVEAGCDRIVTCEHKAEWLAKALELLSPYPQVTVMPYINQPEVRLDALAGQQFDLVFVDSPVGIEARSAVRHPNQEDCSRLNTVFCALTFAPVVLLHDAKRPGEQATLRCAEMRGYAVTMIDTAKGIARIARPKGLPL